MSFFLVLMMWYIYALHTQDKSRIYIGMTQDPETRLFAHNKGKVSSTKAYAPWTRFFLEAVGDDASIAREKEKYFKSTSGRRFLKALFK
jgi:putative endonuclease